MTMSDKRKKIETTPCPKCQQTGWCEHRNEAAKRMFDCARAAVELEKKTDEEIAKLLEDHVWADISMLDPKSDLVSEAIERLRRAKGGARPEDHVVDVADMAMEIERTRRCVCCKECQSDLPCAEFEENGKCAWRCCCNG